jgi:uncharacterized protein GlcG (DUF336 family)
MNMANRREQRSPASGIRLAEAEHIVDRARAHGRALELPPLTVAVLDAAGRLVVLKREDGSSLLRPEIAQAKAFGALAMGMGSRALGERAQTHPAFMQSIIALAGGALVPVPGGVLMFDSADCLLGAVGISGALSDQDEACAIAGIQASGFVAETGSRH